MALHKLNVLHWHLTDDQGWRIEIKRYPKLTEVGAWRAPQPSEIDLVDPATGKYGGFYTQEQIRDIVRHAAERYITIVPEIDMPGHAQAAIAAYPQLGVTGAQPPVSSDWGINTCLYNVDEDHLHLHRQCADRGDGAVSVDPTSTSAATRRRRISGRLRRTCRSACAGLASRRDRAARLFHGAPRKILRAHGRHLVGWDEILDGGLPPDAIVMSWRGVPGAIAAARQGDDVVMAPDPVLYFDHLQSNARDEPPGRVKVMSLADVYAFDPVPHELDAAQARARARRAGKSVERISDHAGARRTRRVSARRRAGRALWSPPAHRNWNDFVARLPAQFERYRTLGIAYSDSAFEPRFATGYDRVDNQVEVKLSDQIDFGTIRYTLDGSEPGSSSTHYATPLTLPVPTTCARRLCWQPASVRRANSST